jgi:hypothetical protein
VREHDDAAEKGEFFKKHDLGRVREIEAREIPHWYPRSCDMTWMSRYQRDALYYYGVRNVADLFTKRNLWARAAIRDHPS